MASGSDQARKPRRSSASRSGFHPRWCVEIGLLASPKETVAQRAKLASPVTHASVDAPPFLVIHGTADNTVDVEHGDRLVEALKKAGAKDVTYLRVEGAGHGVFNSHAKTTPPAMEAFFGRTIGNK